MSDESRAFTLNESWPTGNGGVIAFTVQTPDPVPAAAYPLLAEMSEVAARVAQAFAPDEVDIESIIGAIHAFSGVGVGERKEENP